MRVVIAGNPNAGKTTLFNALTKSNLKTGNWHGVTTFAQQKRMGEYVFVDVPGTYSLSAFSMEETGAIDEIKRADIIINVIDATTLENSLNLTREILGYNKRVIIYLSKRDLLEKRGGRLDDKGLCALLGVPVYRGKVKGLLEEIKNYSPCSKSTNAKLKDCYFAGDDKLKKVEQLFYSPLFASVFFVFALAFTFFITFHPAMLGAVLKDLFQTFLCDVVGGALLGAVEFLPLNSYVSEVIVGGVFGVLCFLPQLALLYSLLIILDESGVASALSFVTDGLFEKVNLSGRAIFSLVSGFGCTAVAIATTRGYTNKSAQRRTIAVLPFIPCGAKLPVFLTLLSSLFQNPFPYVCIFYFSGVALTIATSFLLGGNKESMLSEITPVCTPKIKTCLEKLFFYLKSFIIKLTTSIFLFCTASWLFSHFNFSFAWVGLNDSALCAISKALSPLFLGMGVKDWRIVYATLTGFVAKENVAATIAQLMPDGTGLSLASTMSLCTFLSVGPACVSAFFASVREVGLKFSAKAFGLQLIFAFLSAYLIFFLVALA